MSKKKKEKNTKTSKNIHLHYTAYNLYVIVLFDSCMSLMIKLVDSQKADSCILRLKTKMKQKS